MVTHLLIKPSTLGIALAAGAAVVGAILGAVHALRNPDTDAPLAGIAQPVAPVAQARQMDGNAPAPGLQPLSSADAAVEFPVALQNLPASPYKLALDAKGGRLWWVLPTADATVSSLYEYTLTSAAVTAYAVPASGATGLFSSIDVDGRGHVIFAEGEQVVDFDPAAGTYRRTALPQPEVTTSSLPGFGTPISDMALDDSGHAYISRINVPAITAIDLEDGSMTELPVPQGFGPVFDLESASGSLWLVNTSDIAGGPPSQSAQLDLATGQFRVIPGKTSVIQGDAAGRVYAVGWPKVGLAQITEYGLSPLPVRWRSDIAATLGTDDIVAVDEKTGAIWLTNRALKAIARVDSSDWSVRLHNLPTYSTAYHSCPVLVSCPEKVEVAPSVRGLAVAPNGDLYFSDATLNRIGVIRADR